MFAKNPLPATHPPGLKINPPPADYTTFSSSDYPTFPTTFSSSDYPTNPSSATETTTKSTTTTTKKTTKVPLKANAAIAKAMKGCF